MTKPVLEARDFVHLHIHTQYSLLDGLTKIGPLIDFTKERGMPAVAKTDHGTLSGTIEFYKEAKAKGVKPIIGIEIYVANRKHTDKDPMKDRNRFHLILLAMNNVGYQNLMRLSTIANLDGFYYMPRIDHDLIEKYNDGVIAMSACMGGELGEAIRQNQDDEARKIAQWYKRVFGDRYYLEVQDHGHPDNPLFSKEQKLVNDKILALGKELDIPVVVTCDAHYLKPEDQEAHEVLLCVGTVSFLDEEDRMSLKEYPLHVEEPKDIIARWGKDYPQLITNTKKIADRCNVEIELGKILIPKFAVPKNETEKSYLEKLVYQGLAYRYGGESYDKAKTLTKEQSLEKLSADIKERAEYELNIIESMGFNGYFLIIWDFINWGKNKGIVFGPGRGSAAGSIIAYALRITELDPLKYDLLFERFLNPDRISMPDIDIDIQDSRRDEVIQYCVDKYGADRVANIVTFGRMAARAAVRDVGRVMRVPYGEVDQLAKKIPPPVQGRHIPLEVGIKTSGELKEEYDRNPTAKKIIDMAIRLEGTVRSHGVHAAGVVIAPEDIVRYVPLEMAQKGVIATQYPMGPIEDLGLLKMDFLGLSNLTTIKNALRIIKKVYAKEIDVDQLPLDDKDTYKLLSNGDTTGVFQLESAGMKRYLKELKPTAFDDIIAMVALYRPGPMQFIDDFISRKHGRKAIEYLHPKMENALKSTYGVLVYQEQFMQISKDIAGFSGGQADTLRKAVGKKNMELMKKVKPEFVEGAIKHSGADRKLMEKFWDQLEEFANYCFNKSHAACYGLIAYWTAYLKAHYPAAFMAALMTSDYDDTDRLAIEIGECKRMGIKVLPPDVNQSFHEFAVVPHKEKDKPEIRFGLDAVKNVGHGAAAEIIKVRDENGPFQSIEDFLGKVNSRQVNRKTWESLVKAGGFDRFNNRGAILEDLDNILAAGAKLCKDQERGQTDLFGNAADFPSVKLSIPKSSNLYSEHDYLQWERELLGLYLSQHPLEAYDSYLTEQAVPFKMITAESDGKTVTVGGIISNIRQITTKNGQPMAFVKLEDIVGDERELVVFPGVYKESSDIWQSQKVVIASGKVNSTDKKGTNIDEPKILVDSVRIVSLNEAKDYVPTGKSLKHAIKKAITPSPVGKNSKTVSKRLYIRLDNTSDQQVLQKMKDLLDKHRGYNEAVLVLGEKKQIIKLPQLISGDKGLVEDLKQLLSPEQVKFQ